MSRDLLQEIYAAVALGDYTVTAPWRRVMRAYRRMFDCGLLDSVLVRCATRADPG